MRYRFKVTDENGNLVPNAVISIIYEESYDLNVVNGSLVEEDLFSVERGVPAMNPLVCNSYGLSIPLMTSRAVHPVPDHPFPNLTSLLGKMRETMDRNRLAKQERA